MLPVLSTASLRSGQPVPLALYEESSCISETGDVNSLWRKAENKPSFLVTKRNWTESKKKLGALEKIHPSALSGQKG